MCMLNMLVLMMVTLLILFGFQRPLLLTKEDPLKNGYLNPSNDLLQDYASGGSKWMVDSGCTSHMTGSKEIMTELRLNLNNSTVSYGDKSKAEVKSLDKVVVAKDITLVIVMLVESLGYNLMSVHALNKMNFDVHFTIDMVVLLRSKTLKVMFVGYVDHEFFCGGHFGVNQHSNNVPFRQG